MTGLARDIIDVFPGARVLANVDRASWWVNKPPSEIVAARRMVDGEDTGSIEVEWGKLPRPGGVCVVTANNRDLRFYRALMTGKVGQGLVADKMQTFVKAPTDNWPAMVRDMPALIDVIEASGAKVIIMVGDAMRWWRGDITATGVIGQGYIGVWMGGVDVDDDHAGWLCVGALGAEAAGGRAGVEYTARLLSRLRMLADVVEARDLVALVMGQGCVGCVKGGEVVYRDPDGFGWCRGCEMRGAGAWRASRDRWTNAEGEEFGLWA